MRLERNRVDVLDVVFVVGALVAIVGRVLEATSGLTVGLVVGGVAGTVVFVVVVFSRWVDLEKSDYAAQQPAFGVWGRLRRVLPFGLVLAGGAVVVAGVIRIGWGDSEWFTRYVMGAWWVFVGIVGLCHGSMRFELRRSSAPVATPTDL